MHNESSNMFLDDHRGILYQQSNVHVPTTMDKKPIKFQKKWNVLMTVQVWLYLLKAYITCSFIVETTSNVKPVFKRLKTVTSQAEMKDRDAYKKNVY